MKRTTSSLLVLSVLAAVSAIEVSAQDDGDGRRGMRRGPAVEAIMQMRERLELSEQQIADLDQIRREAVEQRTARMAEAADMRSRLAAGQIRRSEMMAFMEDRRDAAAGVNEERRARIDAVLTEEQRATVTQMRGRARAFVRGRTSARRGGRNGFGPGMPARPGLRGSQRGFDRGAPGRPGGAFGGEQRGFDRGGAGLPEGRRFQAPRAWLRDRVLGNEAPPSPSEPTSPAPPAPDTSRDQPAD